MMTLMLSISACNGENSVEVVEGDRTVAVTVTTDDAADGDACADGVNVVLTRPLADRQVIDGSTGEPVEVPRLVK
jgi:hypothetical protein